MNPILQEYNTPFQTIPFSTIKEVDIKPAMEIALKNAQQKVQTLIDSNENPTFNNLIEPLEQVGKQIGKVSHILFNLNNAETNETLQKIAQDVSPLLSDFNSFVSLNEALFHKIETVYNNENRDNLSSEQNYYLDKKYKGFVRSGVNLPPEKKEKLTQKNKTLSKLALTFGENVLKATNHYFLHITNKDKLKGLPQYALESAMNEAKSRELEGFVFTLQYPSLLAVLKFAENRDLRKEISMASASKCYQDNDFNNTETLRKIVSLRKEKAQLLGYKSYSEFVLEERMAESPEKVQTFLQDLLVKAKPFAQKEVEELKSLAKKDGITEMMGYDHSYYSEKLKEQKFNLKEEETKPYFELNSVKNAAFGLASTLFNLQFNKVENIDTYHQEVEVFEVTENGTHKAILYTDFHPRKGKKPGAWMTTFKDQGKYDGKNIRPHVSIVCNFTPPTETQPSLLTFSEVTTLFHELGHALHMINAETQYQALSGTSVLWDFVELPSQFLENYCYEPEFLQQFAKHYQTQEPISTEMIEKLKASGNFMEGYQTLRQISFGLIDMAYHSEEIYLENTNLEAFEDSIMEETKLYPNTKGSCFSTAFSHIFAGGYASGYYSYKWAEVLDADAFSYFKEEGIFNPELATKFKTMLAQGGTQNPATLYKTFRGKQPNPEALLKRAGLVF